MTPVGERPAALVTGSTRGIGRSTALELGRRGFDVAVNCSRSREAGEQVVAELQALGAGAVLCPADVADEGQVRGMAQAVETAFGRLDALVNNAGTTIATPPADLEGLDMADWDRVFAVNVRGLFQVTRACLPLLRRSPTAAVVNLASIAGLRPGAQPLPYSASKAAVAALTRTLAGALGPEVRVNAVAPGLVDTPWTADWDAVRAVVQQVAPLKRSGRPEEVAEVIVALARAEYVTGQVVGVDGGMSIAT